MPIKVNSSGIGAIAHDGKMIGKVFQGTSLVWESFKDGELVHEATSGSKSLTVKKGYYRVQMSGGGGQYGYCSYHKGHSECCIATQGCGKTASAGSGAAFYGIIYVPSDQTISVSVGGVGGATSAFGITCGAGYSATGGEPTYHEYQYTGVASAGSGGSVSNSGAFTVVVAGLQTGGSSGTTADYANASGGSGRLSYSGSNANLPAISKTSYGKGSIGVYSGSTGAMSSGATGGYLRIERCKYKA